MCGVFHIMAIHSLWIVANLAIGKKQIDRKQNHALDNRRRRKIVLWSIKNTLKSGSDV